VGNVLGPDKAFQLLNVLLLADDFGQALRPELFRPNFIHGVSPSYGGNSGDVVMTINSFDPLPGSGEPSSQGLVFYEYINQDEKAEQSKQ
jgi:hypothetical protein